MTKLYKCSWFCALLCILLLNGCRLAVSVPNGGDVLSRDGKVFCASGQKCSFEITDTDFSNSFYASASFGYRFAGWSSDNRHFCSGSLRACSLATTNFANNDMLMSFLSSDETFFLSPIFRALNRHNISGRANVPPSVTIDSDVNDPRATLIGNNDLSSAQPAEAPGVVVGYVANMGTGSEGAISLAGDTADYFQVTLIRGQKISLIAENNIRGELKNSAGVTIAALSSDYLEAPSAGIHYIAVFPENSASNYMIKLSSPAAKNSLTVLNQWPTSVFIGDLESVDQISTSENWLSVRPHNVTENGVGEYKLSIEGGYTEGSYSANLTTRNSGKRNTIQVVGYVARADSRAHTAPLYSALYSDTFIRVAGEYLSVASSSVKWSFHDIPQGHYHLVVSTDMNNDGKLCDVGELCGYYQPHTAIDGFPLHESLENIDLVVSPISR